MNECEKRSCKKCRYAIWEDQFVVDCILFQEQIALDEDMYQQNANTMIDHV